MRYRQQSFVLSCRRTRKLCDNEESALNIDLLLHYDAPLWLLERNNDSGKFNGLWQRYLRHEKEKYECDDQQMQSKEASKKKLVDCSLHTLADPLFVALTYVFNG